MHKLLNPGVMVILVVVALCGPSCEDLGVFPPNVNFQTLAVGQRSLYVRFTGPDYFSASGSNISYQRDTLVLEVTGKYGDSYELTERFNSKTVRYLLRISRDMVTISRRDSTSNESHLFFAWGWNYQVRLPMTITSQEIHLVGWRTSLEYCECYGEGYLSDYRHFGKQYDQVNVVVDNRLFAGDGVGMTYIYTREGGLLRSSTVSWWPPNTVQGWSLIQ